VDVRVVAATHRDLESMVADGSFRQDLWYRLSVFPIRIPPLRERLADIDDLARFFMARAAARIGFPLLDLTPENLGVLQSYRWPGNARELSAVIERAVILGEGRTVDVRGALGMAHPSAGRVRAGGVDAYPDESQALEGSADSTSASIGGSGRKTSAGPRVQLTLDQAIAEHIELVLHATAGVVEGPDGAAARLGENASTLRSRMKRLGLDPRRFRR
jgi:transcriptional regulator with GAF, ATPase, and Fis domain